MKVKVYNEIFQDGKVISSEEQEIDVQITVPNAALRKFLIDLGIYKQVNDYITNSNNLELQMLWEFATEINIDNENVLILKDKLGLSNDGFLNIFQQAKLLNIK